MSREIKFRGMTKDKKWVYGNLIINNERESDGIHKKESLHTFIREQNKRWNAGNKCWTHFGYEVLPETVGQFTGLKDKDGKEIYEGDICLAALPEERFKVTVIYCLPATSFLFEWPDDSYESGIDEMSMDCFTDIEVIGNVHENPELLGEQK